MDETTSPIDNSYSSNMVREQIMDNKCYRLSKEDRNEFVRYVQSQSSRFYYSRPEHWKWNDTHIIMVEFIRLSTVKHKTAYKTLIEQTQAHLYNKRGIEIGVFNTHTTEVATIRAYDLYDLTKLKLLQL